MVDFLRGRVLYAHDSMERFHAVYLDAERSFLGDAPMGEGCTDSLSVRMRDVIGRALKLDAQSILIAHNHPSGDCHPSQIDVEATARLKRVAEALDIELLDHLIVTQDAVYSMRAGEYL